MRTGKLNGELTRLKTVIETDRLNVADNFDELITADLTSLLSDYFDLKTPPQMSIVKENGYYLVRVEAIAFRIKTFGVVPK